MPKTNRLDKKHIFIANTLHESPPLLDKVRENLKDIFDMLREYIPRKKYDVTSHGYSAITAIIDRYFSTKKMSTEFADTFSGRTDKFLIDIYEELTALSKITVNSRDLQGTLQIVRCFKVIAIQAITFPPMVDNNDNFTCTVASFYLKQIVISSLNVGMDDVGLEGIRALKNIESNLPFDYYYTILSLINDINDVALYGLHQFYIVDEATTALVQIYKSRSALGTRDTLGHHILDRLKQISNAYLTLKPKISVGCEGLGAVFNTSRSDSLPTHLIHILKKILIEKDGEVFRDIFHLYSAVGEEAGKQDSFLIHFIIQSIHSIISASIEFLAVYPDFEKKENKEKVFDELAWLSSVYWRIYQNQPKVYNTYYIELEGIDNLVALVLYSIEQGFEILAKKLTDEVFSIISVGLKKKPNDEFTVPRLLVHGVKIGVVARTKKLDKLADEILNRVHEEFSQFLSQQKPGEMPEGYFETNFKQSLSREMWKIYLEFKEMTGRPTITFSSDFYFYRMVELSRLKDYLNEIEKKVYNRTINDIRRSSII